MTDRGSIEELLRDYRDAVYAKDIDSFVTLYDDDMRAFDMWARWSYQGVDEWRGMATEWFASLGTDRAVVEWHDVRTDMGVDLASVHALITIRGLSADGVELRSMQNRLTWIVRRVNGAWKVVHEHTSAPLDPETTKAILRR